ncbi:50S ribosomal protein L24 [Proteinivorax tanatarense]|uniref:Large ribosomal subunit protein uL24 n=1 Tax=Proteinivorax tanatarense TaxID=1260629 RepID=A0AAU7VMS3_9FIRM
MTPKVHVKKDDKVVVLSGKDKGKSGKVLKVIPRDNKVVVEGANIQKKHAKPTRNNPQGGVIEQEAPLYSSKVQLVCPRCDKPARVGARFLEDGKKVRDCKKCGEVIDK